MEEPEEERPATLGGLLEMVLRPTSTEAQRLSALQAAASDPYCDPGALHVPAACLKDSSPPRHRRQSIQGPLIIEAIKAADSEDGALRMLQLLLRHGASASTCDVRRVSALAWSLRRGFYRAGEALLAAGATMQWSTVHSVMEWDCNCGRVQQFGWALDSERLHWLLRHMPPRDSMLDSLSDLEQRSRIPALIVDSAQHACAGLCCRAGSQGALLAAAEGVVERATRMLTVALLAGAPPMRRGDDALSQHGQPWKTGCRWVWARLEPAATQRAEWSPALHRYFPPRFRAAARQALLASNRGIAVPGGTLRLDTGVAQGIVRQLASAQSFRDLTQ